MSEQTNNEVIPIESEDFPVDIPSFIAGHCKTYVDELMTTKSFFSINSLYLLFEKNHPDVFNAFREQHPNMNLKEAKEKYNQLIYDLTDSTVKLVPVFPSQKLSFQYTTAEMIKMERELVDMAKGVSSNHMMEDDFLELVQQAFKDKPTMAEEQKNFVLASCLTNKNVVITEGTAGAGKSYSLDAVRYVYENVPPRIPSEQKGYQIIGTAISWSAAKVLEESANLPGSMSMAKLIYQMEAAAKKGTQFFTRRTLIIVDEAGLASTENIYKLLFHANNSKQDVRVILTGDSFQLNPVQAGNALELLVSECGSVRLDTIRRQKQESHANAVKHFCYGRAENGLYVYQQQENIVLAENKQDVMKRIVEEYISYTSYFKEKSMLVLALSNNDVDNLNQLIRSALQDCGRVDRNGFFLESTDGKKVKKVQFSIGDQIVFRKNKPKHIVYKTDDDKKEQTSSADEGKSTFLSWIRKKISQETGIREELKTGLFNRTIGTIIDLKEADGGIEFRVRLNEGGEVFVNTNDYLDENNGAVPIMHNFATTIYSSQGQTVSKVLLMDDPLINRKLAYVGASRHKEECLIYLNKEEIATRIRKRIRFQKETAVRKLNERLKTDPMAEIDLSRIDSVYPDFPPGHKFTEMEYIGAVATTWNSRSDNETVLVHRKRNNERIKTDKNWKSPLSPWTNALHKADEDDINDYMKEPCAIFPSIEIKSKPVSEDDLRRIETYQPKGFLGSMVKKMVGAKEEYREHYSIVTPDPLPVVNHMLGRESEHIDLSTLSDDLLEKSLGVFWGKNKHGDARIIANDPLYGFPRARYDLLGNIKVGDGEIPVVRNDHGNSQTPFMVMSSLREAILARNHYCSKYAAEPEKIPHFVILLKDVDIRTFEGWLHPDPIILVTNSKTRDDNIGWIKQAQKKISSIGFSSQVFPKLPNNPEPAVSEPGKTSQAHVNPR